MTGPRGWPRRWSSPGPLSAAFANTSVLVGAATGRLSPIAAALMHNGTTLAVLAASWMGRHRLLKGGTAGSGHSARRWT